MELISQPIWRLLFLMVVMLNGCYGCWEQERIALLQLKASLNHPNGRSLPSWFKNTRESSDCCQWERVQCNANTGRVIKLGLNYTRDWDNSRDLESGHWYLNASMFLPFQELKILNLSGNQLVGWYDNKGSPRLTNLEVLDLSDNYLNNGILSSLGGLTSLKSLNLRNTSFNGSVQTKDLDALINLEELVLSENEVNGFVARKGIKSLSKLKVLYLDSVYCNNTSILLRSMGAFSFLKTIYLRNRSYSSLQEKINAHDLHDLNNLEELLLDYSSVNNNFLQGVGFMFSLKALSLRGCQLNGTLHAKGLCKLKNLQELDISDNQFHGLLPSCLGNLTSLRLLDLAYNQFTGYIASSPLTSLTWLEYLSLSYNHFHAPISFKLFSNHSNLKVILSDSIKLEVEPEFETWVPRFQLKVFSLSNCTFDELYLQNNSFIQPPNFLIHQNDLRVVDLSHNFFGGRLPTWLLKNNTRLEVIQLRNNSFTGPVGLLSHPNPHMSTFDISDNKIQGQIPLNMSFLFPNVGRVNLSRNSFSGYIPSCFGDMKSITSLDMSNNQLAGGIPERLTIGCPSLMLLKLSNNYLQRIPKLFNLTSLLFLYLDGNNFVGEIPNGFSNSPLVVLDISKNHFSGKLPRWIGNMSDLNELAMFRNHLQGSIPKEFCKLDSLIFLGLSENNLSGSIPSCFNSSDTKYVHLSKNKLRGSLRQTIFNCSSLVTLDLSENDLTGNIPNWIGTLSSLSILLLKGNRFEGRIPNEICHLKKLSMIDLSQNNLFGPIPPCLSNSTFEATDEKFLIRGGPMRLNYSPWYLASKFLNGTILKRDENNYSISRWSYMWYPLIDVEEQVEFTTKSRSYYYKGQTLKLISGIDLSCNQLTGEIPHQIGNLHNIQVLNLSRNNLTGSIPTTFSNLRVIESLDLSYNHLNGNIPSQLIEIQWLAVFSVAHNNLSGMTPERKGQFGTFEESSYKGNPFLCGPPLHNNCTTSGSPSPTIPNGEVEDGSFIDMNIFSVSFLVAYITVLLGIATILYINPYWRQVWFHVIEVGITSCYYFVLDNIPKKLIYKNM